TDAEGRHAGPPGDASISTPSGRRSLACSGAHLEIGTGRNLTAATAGGRRLPASIRERERRWRRSAMPIGRCWLVAAKPKSRPCRNRKKPSPSGVKAPAWLPPQCQREHLPVKCATKRGAPCHAFASRPTSLQEFCAPVWALQGRKTIHACARTSIRT